VRDLKLNWGYGWLHELFWSIDEVSEVCKKKYCYLILYASSYLHVIKYVLLNRIKKCAAYITGIKKELFCEIYFFQLVDLHTRQCLNAGPFFL
jgi:hypothetical protein